jgi:predicted porin
MQKKLLAVAVAGALAAPAIAVAQTSTVQIYGQLTYEYGRAEQGSSRPKVDYADTPGGSAIGFRGEEKLGGNLSAWFQCESSADTTGVDQQGLCSRNSAVGLRGAFGNIQFGKWDTPFKLMLNLGTVGAEETGILGMSFLPFGGSGGSDISGGLGNDSAQRQRWKRREANLIMYTSPNFNGFQVMGAFTSANAASTLPTANTNASQNQKPRLWDIAATYVNGPLRIGIGYERHEDMGAHQEVTPCTVGTRNADGTIACTAGAIALPRLVGLNDDAWGIAASYTFMGKLRVGFTYLDATYEMGAGLSMDKRTWTLGADWNVSGPHSIMAQYAYADDTKGNSTVSIGGNGGITAPMVNATTPRTDTGGKAFSIGYQYAFSKRTSVKIAYVRVDNDTNTAVYRIGNTATVNAGDNNDSYGFLIRHRF